MKRHAVIDQDGNVVNVIIWDGVCKWKPPEGHIVVQHDLVDSGDVYNFSTRRFTKVADQPSEFHEHMRKNDQE